MQQVEKEMLSAQETARYLGISRTTLWRKCKRGVLPGPVRMAGLTRWRRTQLVAFLDAVSGGDQEAPQ